MASDTILSNGDFDYNWTAIDSNSNWALLQQSIFDGIWDKIDLDDDLNNGSFDDNYTRNARENSGEITIESILANIVDCNYIIKENEYDFDYNLTDNWTEETGEKTVCGVSLIDLEATVDYLKPGFHIIGNR